MFDRLAWRRECYERYLLGLDDDETPMGDSVRMADDAEAGRVELPSRTP